MRKMVSFEIDEDILARYEMFLHEQFEKEVEMHFSEGKDKTEDTSTEKEIKLNQK